MKLFIATILLILSTTFASAKGTIVLLVDISSSISIEDMKLQLESYANSMRSVGALRSKDIVVMTFSEWPKLLTIGDYNDAYEVFMDYAVVEPVHRGSTCLGRALQEVENIMPTLEQPIVLDISGDGESNCENSHQVHPILDRLEQKYDLQVNTLYVRSDKINSNSDLDKQFFAFYKTLVRGGGFTMKAETFMDFELSLFDKLTIELSWLDNQ